MSSDRQTIEAFFRAMQSGASAEADMMRLFAEDAIYIEPFTGTPQTHVGKHAILATMQAGWSHPLPDMTLSLDRVDIDGNEIRVAWTCRSPALPGGSGRGVNTFSMRNGLIARLETALIF